MFTRFSPAILAGLACFTIVGLSPATTWGAQKVARTFEQLKPEVITGDTLTVTNRSGAKTVGKLVRLSESELTIETEEGMRTFAASDVRRVDCKRRGPVWNGLIIGAAAGGIPTWVALKDENEIGGVVGGFALIGAGVGLLIDVLNTGNVRVFESQPATARISIAPLVSPARKGVVVSVRF